MNNQNATTKPRRTKFRPRAGVLLAFLATLLIGSLPRTGLADNIVIINQPDEYIVVDPIDRGPQVIVEEPAPSCVVIDAAPPPLRVEVRPPRPFAGAIWVGGYWWWSGVRYEWTRGHYVRPHPGYRFVAPRWVRSGGRYYHVRGHYRPYGATVRHRPYDQYRRASYYGERYRYPRYSSRPTYRGHHPEHRGHHRGHGGDYRGHDHKSRGHSYGPPGHDRYRGYGNDHRGHGGHRGPDHARDRNDRPRGEPAVRRAPPAQRVAPARGPGNRYAGATPRRTSPSARASVSHRAR